MQRDDNHDCISDADLHDDKLLDGDSAEDRRKFADQLGADELALYGNGNPATSINGVEEAEALARYHLATSAAALSLAADKAAEEPGSISAAGLESMADAIANRLRRCAELMRVFER